MRMGCGDRTTVKFTPKFALTVNKTLAFTSFNVVDSVIFTVTDKSDSRSSGLFSPNDILLHSNLPSSNVHLLKMLFFPRYLKHTNRFHCHHRHNYMK